MLFTIVSGCEFGNQPIQPPLRCRSWAGVEFYSGVFSRDSHLEWRKYPGRFPFARTGQPTVEMKEGVGSVSELIGLHSIQLVTLFETESFSPEVVHSSTVQTLSVCE